jgi:hypothetical protein
MEENSMMSCISLSDTFHLNIPLLHSAQVPLGIARDSSAVGGRIWKMQYASHIDGEIGEVGLLH